MADNTSEPTEYMLTTFDNPFNPFNQFDEWFAWDRTAGYNSPSLLARIVNSSDELSDTDQVVAINDAIDEILKENVTGMFRKVSKPEAPTNQS